MHVALKKIRKEISRMTISKERSQKIVNDMVETLGPGAIIEYAGNTNFFMAELLKSNGAAPEDISGHLALQYFFMDVIAKEFGVDQELLELDTYKCYVSMEKILNDAKKSVADQTDGSNVIDMPGTLGEFGNRLKEAMINQEQLKDVPNPESSTDTKALASDVCEMHNAKQTGPDGNVYNTGVSLEDIQTAISETPKE